MDKIVLASELKSTDTVLEIGPGTGNLTLRLLPLVRRVTALDVDERMVGEVKKRALTSGYTNLDARHGDALRSDLGKFDVCVANLPYQISSPFIFKLLAHRPLFRTAVLMFQKEFAERLMARPSEKAYCRLSINTQVFCRVDRVCLVKAGSFSPPPKVDSMVVKLTPRRPPLQIDFREWDGMLRICFMRKRKTLHSVFTIRSVLTLLENNYLTWCTLTKNVPDLTPMKSVIESVLTETGLAGTRAVVVGIEQYLTLLLAFHKRHIHFRNLASSPAGNLENDVTDPFAGLKSDFYFKCNEMEDDETCDKDDDDAVLE